MTSTTSDIPATVDRELGHPVRSFVLVLVTLALLLLAVQASGLAQPRVGYFSTGGGRAPESGAVYQVVMIRNDGLLPIRVQSVSWTASGIEDVVAGVLPPGREGPVHGSAAGTAPLTEPFTLDRGERRGIVVSGVETCPGSFGLGPPRVRARTAAGIVRTVEVEDVEVDPGPGCP